MNINTSHQNSDSEVVFLDIFQIRRDGGTQPRTAIHSPTMEPTFGSPIDKVQKKYEIGRIIQALRVANYTESLNSKYSVSRTHEVQ